MQNIMNLRRRGCLTEQQVLTAARFKKNPNDFKLEPTLFRILYDIVVRDVSLEAIEKERGWSARSAKVVLSQLLYAIEEVQGIWWGEDQTEGQSEKDDMIQFITGNDDQQISGLMAEYGFTGNEARMFLILKHDLNRVLSKETILRRLYHGRSEDEYPELKIVDVFVCKMRKKLANQWIIKTVWGEGYRLLRADSHETEQAA